MLLCGELRKLSTNKFNLELKWYKEGAIIFATAKNKREYGSDRDNGTKWVRCGDSEEEREQNIESALIETAGEKGRGDQEMGGG